MRDMVGEVAREAGFWAIEASAFTISPYMSTSVVSDVASVDCVIADMTDQRTDVYFEIGLAQAMGKPILLLCEKNRMVREPEALRELPWIWYEATAAGMTELRGKIYKTLQEFERLLVGATFTSNARLAAPFVVAWERLDRSDIDNLCFELLAQMGYRQVEWNTRRRLKEVDIIAEYPKTDPDGYSYEELWLVALGRQTPLINLLQAVKDPEFLESIAVMAMDDLYNLVFSEKASREKYLPIIYLIIMADNVLSVDEFNELRNRLEARPQKRLRPTDVRVRIWD